METKLGNSYWDGNGAYQSQMDSFIDKFIPESGRAATLTGEIVRAANRLYYEYLNNGNINAIDVQTQSEECPYCGGSGIDSYGEECLNCEGEGVIENYSNPEINRYYENFITLIETTLRNDSNEILTICDKVREIILTAYDEELSNYFSPENRNVYDRLMDMVAEWTIKNENVETLIPEDYENDKS